MTFYYRYVGIQKNGDEVGAECKCLYNGMVRTLCVPGIVWSERWGWMSGVKDEGWMSGVNVWSERWRVNVWNERWGWMSGVKDERWMSGVKDERWMSGVKDEGWMSGVKDEDECLTVVHRTGGRMCYHVSTIIFRYTSFLLKFLL